MTWLLCWLFAACVTATPAPTPAPAADAPAAAASAGSPHPLPPPVALPPDLPGPPETIRLELATAPPPDLAASGPGSAPAWQRYAMPTPPAEGRPTISVVIDDMGLAASQSARAVALPAPVTLSWMPYAPHLAEQVAAAMARGHETMLHMPMEPLGRADPGPHALRTWLPPATNLLYLRAALDLLPRAVAMNQHEGSAASLSVPLMDLVMRELKARRMAFLDSVTVAHDVALRRAAAAGVPAVARDVFIDNDPNPAAIRARLADAERIAARRGHAVLIGHPRPATMEVLEQYLPTLAARGFVLWPITATVVAETQMQMSGGAASPPGRPTNEAAQAAAGLPATAAVAPPPGSRAE